jgi:perosamine synthetase
MTCIAWPDSDYARRFNELGRSGGFARADTLFQSSTSCVGDVERALEEKWGIAVTLTVSAGGTAVQLALLAAGVKQGDGVLLPAFTPAETLAAVLAVGAVPHIVDIDPATFTLDPAAAALALAQPTARIAAMIAVHLLGQPVMLQPLVGLSTEYQVPLIEDATHAPGIGYVGRYAGTVAGGGGDFGCLALSKELPLSIVGEGGAPAVPG